MWLVVRTWQALWVLLALEVFNVFLALALDGPVGPVVLGAVLAAVSSALRAWVYLRPQSRIGMAVQQAKSRRPRAA